MTSNLPKFDSPPVVETVLSAQFHNLAGYSTAHAGWFWKNYLDSNWTTVKEVQRLDDQLEQFGDEKQWVMPSFKISTSPQAERLHIIREDKERLIQLQDSRFIYNWKKGENAYPSFHRILPEFQDTFEKYQQFIKDSEFGELKLNQWEVTYVNHIEKGDLWESASDWGKILPVFVGDPSSEAKLPVESFQGDWKLIIGENQGRLHISLKHAKVASGKGPEVIVLQFTARGPISEENGLSLEKGLNLGHESIVKTFGDITSNEAQKHWGRRN